MLKFVEDVLFAPKIFSHLQTSDGKQGDNGHTHSVSETNSTKEIPEEYKMLLYMVS